MKRGQAARQSGNRRDRTRHLAFPPSLVKQQKQVLLRLAGVVSSGFTDVSEHHDQYLYAKAAES